MVWYSVMKKLLDPQWRHPLGFAVDDDGQPHIQILPGHPGAILARTPSPERPIRRQAVQEAQARSWKAYPTKCRTLFP
jgi:hypothetical protein